jgi:hypothetical protein
MESIAMNEDRGPWYLFTGLILGLILGVVWGWYVAPVSYTDTEPATLIETSKDEYRTLIALSFQYNNDAARSQSRLSLLQDTDPVNSLAALAQRANANSRPEGEIQAISRLALIAAGPPAGIPTAVPLTVFPTLTAVPSPTMTPVPDVEVSNTPAPGATLPPPTQTPQASETLQVTPTAAPTETPFPTATPTATQGNPFILDSRLLSCPSNGTVPSLVVQTFDKSGTGVPGVEVILNWADSEEYIFTGLKPELGLGYADFQMSPGIRYTLRLADGSQLITDITPEQCDPGSGQLVWGTLELTFVQP